MRRSNFHRDEAYADLPKRLIGHDERRVRRLTQSFGKPARSRQATYQPSGQAFTHRGIAKLVVRQKGPSGWAHDRSPRAYGVYLERGNKMEIPSIEKAEGFNDERSDIPVSETVAAWHDDRKYFEIILSPDTSRNVSMPELTRMVMASIEHDLGTKLEWVSVIHHDTDHTHAHVMVRGVDERGKDLWIDPQYRARGIGDRLNQALTRQHEREAEIGRERSR